MSLQIRHTDKVAAVLLVGLAVGVFVASRDFPSGFGNSPGAAFFPRLIVSIIALLAGVLFVWSVVSSENRTYDVSATDAGRFAVPVVLLVVYVALMPILGFIIDTVAFLVVLTLYSGVESYWRSGALAVGLSLALHYAFGEFLHIPLPEGSLVSVARWLPSLPLSGVV